MLSNIAFLVACIALGLNVSLVILTKRHLTKIQDLEYELQLLKSNNDLYAIKGERYEQLFSRLDNVEEDVKYILEETNSMYKLYEINDKEIDRLKMWAYTEVESIFRKLNMPYTGGSVEGKEDEGKQD